MHAGGVAVLSQLYMAAGVGLGVGGWGVGGLGVGAGGGVGGVGAGGGVGGAGAVQFTLAQHYSCAYATHMHKSRLGGVSE